MAVPPEGRRRSLSRPSLAAVVRPQPVRLRGRRLGRPSPVKPASAVSPPLALRPITAGAE